MVTRLYGYNCEQTMRRLRSVATKNNSAVKIQTYLSASEILNLPTLPAPSLRSRLNTVALRLKQTALSKGLCSLSANQINYPLSIFVCLRKNKLVSNKWCSYDPSQFTIQDYEAVINPQLVKTSFLKEYNYEECSSIEGFKFKVQRHAFVVVSYENDSKKEVEERKEGFQGRVWQHEMTHMDGKLILDTEFCRDEVEIS